MSGMLSAFSMLGTFMAVILAAFLIVVPSRMRTANVLLALFLVATAIDISGWFMDAWWREHPNIGSLRPVVAFLQMPLFAGFIWFTCFQDSKLRPRDLVHLIPALVTLCMLLSGLAMPWLRVLFEVQYLLYIAISVAILWRFKTHLNANYAKRSPSWHWLATLIATSVAAHSFFLVRTMLLSDLSAELSIVLQSAAAMLVLAITIWIAFQALLRPDLFRNADPLLLSVATSFNQDVSDQHDQLIKVMEEQRPHLDPDLSISRLAKRAGLPARDVSTLINQRYGCHFFDFINRHRVDHAKTLLAETDQSVTDIIYASGFNAKSSFNTAFRKHTGLTPSAYRRTISEK